MTTSFGKHTKLRPQRYRTPSPPRYAVEPLSPSPLFDATNAGQDWPASLHKQNRYSDYRSTGESLPLIHNESRHGHRPNGSMEMFATIALATQSSTASLQTNTTFRKRTLDDRSENVQPTKRARSEKLLSPDFLPKSMDSETRPTTGSEQSRESKMREAELLLHFSQSVTNEWLSCTRQANQLSPTGKASESMLRSPSSSPLSQKLEITQDDQRQRVDDRQSQHEGQELNLDRLSYLRVPSQTGERDALEPPSPFSDPLQASRGPQAFTMQSQSPNLIQNHHLSDTRILSNLRILSDNPGEYEDELYAGETKGVQKEHLEQLDNTAIARNSMHDSPAGIQKGSNVIPKGCNNDSHKPFVETTDTDDAQVEDLDFINVDSDTNRGSAYLKGQIAPEARRESFEKEIKDINAVSKGIMSSEDVFEEAKSTGHDISTESVQSPSSAVCAACNFARNSMTIDSESQATSWIRCDGCKSWFHFSCAGFKNEREVRGVDKFRCRKCKPIYGATTYVRKSSRAHSAIDYAGLHQGVIKTSDDRPEHHYIQPIRDGTISFLPETFARMRPELVTAEYFEKGSGMREPIVIPAALNPQPKSCESPENAHDRHHQAFPQDHEPDQNANSEDWFCHDIESQTLPDEGQDALDMVMPKGLTVRKVAELYGLDEKVEVIDVKSQNGENKKWNMRRWAEYYENYGGNKTVRNVISLEVSQSKLGRLIRRPQIVRDLDLQDAVWPQDLTLKGEYPRVQFYCLMSVADCFTDFHIDFGGSSVFYHILKGKKTFLFIPPKEKHLKKYEEWCMSPAQNWTFLADQTKECYRVDLSEGDTMLIPSGWIHAVWTPEDSLVIGGNFLTRMNYAMQLRIAQAEKATGVARKFRYPHFQKLHWYTVFKYLKEDPLPKVVRDLLESGFKFDRTIPTHHEFDDWGENSRHGAENYHARYYSQPELDGLPDLVRYVLRTVLIDIGSITDGISAETRNAVRKSIPRGCGEPMDIAKTFAIWCAWKRGNEPIPHWAYPGAVEEVAVSDKLSAAASRKMAEEAALKAPRRQSARMQSQKESKRSTFESEEVSVDVIGYSHDLAVQNTVNGSLEQSDKFSKADMAPERTPKKARTTSSGAGSHRKTACESCRRRRRACKHKDSLETSAPSIQVVNPSTSTFSTNNLLNGNTLQEKLSSIGGLFNSITPKNEPVQVLVPPLAYHDRPGNSKDISSHPTAIVASAPSLEAGTTNKTHDVDAVGELDSVSGTTPHSRPRTKACSYCRKSKVSIKIPDTYILPKLIHAYTFVA